MGDEEWDANQLASARQLSQSLGDEVDDAEDVPARRMSKLNHSTVKDSTHDLYNELLPICKHLAHPFYDEIHPVIVRRNHIKDLEGNFISDQVAKPAKEAYHKIYEEDFTKDMAKTKKDIVSRIEDLIKPVKMN